MDDNFDKLDPSKLDYELFKLIDEKSIFGRHYNKLCEILKQNGVPPTRMPTMAHFMSKIFQIMDEEKYNDWINKYIDMEGVSGKEGDEN
jgi:hypothetical protein